MGRRNVVQEVETEVETEAAEVESTEPKAPAAPAKLIRGRMPLPLVWNIRFKSLLEDEATDSSVAKMYFTTAGKIMDIRQNKNFRYLMESTTFGADDIADAREQLTKNILEGKTRKAAEASGDYSIEDAKSLFDMLDDLEAEFSTVRADRDTYNEANPRANKKAVVEEEVAADVEEDAFA